MTKKIEKKIDRLRRTINAVLSGEKNAAQTLRMLAHSLGRFLVRGDLSSTQINAVRAQLVRLKGNLTDPQLEGQLVGLLECAAAASLEVDTKERLQADAQFCLTHPHILHVFQTLQTGCHTYDSIVSLLVDSGASPEEAEFTVVGMERANLIMFVGNKQHAKLELKGGRIYEEMLRQQVHIQTLCG